MKSIHRILAPCALALGLAVAGDAVADETRHKSKHHTAAAVSKAAGELVKPAKQDAAWLAKARAEYPLQVCLTSDEKLGSMGDNAEFIYREKGKPDRLVVFCCAGCEEDFTKEPAKYLAKLDAAAKQKRK